MGSVLWTKHIQALIQSLGQLWGSLVELHHLGISLYQLASLASRVSLASLAQLVSLA